MAFKVSNAFSAPRTGQLSSFVAHAVESFLAARVENVDQTLLHNCLAAGTGPVGAGAPEIFKEPARTRRPIQAAVTEAQVARQVLRPFQKHGNEPGELHRGVVARGMREGDLSRWRDPPDYGAQVRDDGAGE